MKIAMIGHKRIPSREGGIEIVVGALAVRMAGLGHTVHAYNRLGRHVSNVKTASKKIKTYEGVRVITAPTIPVRAFDALVYSFFATIMALFGRYDVIHYHAEGPAAMVFIPKLFGIRTVVTIHGLDWQRSKWGGVASKYLKTAERILSKRADEVVVMSKANRAYFNREYGRETRLIHNAVDPPAARPAKLIKELYGLDGGDYVLFLSRLTPEKGLHYLLEAYKAIDTPLRLVVAGGSSHSDDYVLRMRELGAADPRVIFTGFVQGELLEELYSNCFMYVLPSDIEGMPLSLMEAMSCGRYCLVSDIDENLDVLGGMGESFIRGDAGSLREKLTGILGAAVFTHTPEEISASVRTRYNWDSITEQYLNVYKGDPD